MFETVLSEMTGEGVRTITLNRPDSLNAMNGQLIADVAAAFAEANEDEATRAMVFTGAGRAFCAGDDLAEHSHPGSEAQARAVVDAIQRCTRAIVFSGKPVVGAINGWAVGGGFEWAINCDFPIWAKSARGFFPEVSWGLFVTGGVTALLPALAGLGKAREMLFLGERYGANDLLEAGVAWRVVEDDELLDEAGEVARKLAGLPSQAVQDMKRTLHKVALGDLEAATALETDATVRGFLDEATTRRIAGFGKKGGS
ncbi:MAG: enoyl-CoA hydratase/isomerase family protein [Alphaproteobacteria bacterium]|nr:enoyl-CoA hydratase/isomerase family protein [Alphaproteobacteria bacterium]